MRIQSFGLLCGGGGFDVTNGASPLNDDIPF